jgi:hypothetical protein
MLPIGSVAMSISLDYDLWLLSGAAVWLAEESAEHGSIPPSVPVRGGCR